MTGDRLDARQRAFCDALAALIREYTDVAGPVEDDEFALDAESRSGQPTLPNAALAEWVLVLSWVDLDSGDSYITKACQPGMLAHHQLGLLRSWLVELERQPFPCCRYMTGQTSSSNFAIDRSGHV